MDTTHINSKRDCGCGGNMGAKTSVAGAPLADGVMESYLGKVIEFARRDSRFDLCLDYYICERRKHPVDPTPVQWAVVERVRNIFAQRPDLQPAFCKRLTGG